MHNNSLTEPLEIQTIEPDVLNKIQQLLTHYVGPFAKFLIEESLDHEPDILPEKLIDILYQEIAILEIAEAFRFKALSVLQLSMQDQ